MQLAVLRKATHKLRMSVMRSNSMEKSREKLMGMIKALDSDIEEQKQRVIKNRCNQMVAKQEYDRELQLEMIY